MMCKICGSEKTTETPHPMHGFKINCAECGKFIKWKGKVQDPMEYYLKLAKTAQIQGMKPGWAAHKFKEKFGRFPNWEEKGEHSPEVQKEWDRKEFPR